MRCRHAFALQIKPRAPLAAPIRCIWPADLRDVFEKPPPLAEWPTLQTNGDVERRRHKNDVSRDAAAAAPRPCAARRPGWEVADEVKPRSAKSARPPRSTPSPSRAGPRSRRHRGARRAAAPAEASPPPRRRGRSGAPTTNMTRVRFAIAASAARAPAPARSQAISAPYVLSSTPRFCAMTSGRSTSAGRARPAAFDRAPRARRSPPPAPRRPRRRRRGAARPDGVVQELRGFMFWWWSLGEPPQRRRHEGAPRAAGARRRVVAGERLEPEHLEVHARVPEAAARVGRAAAACARQQKAQPLRRRPGAAAPTAPSGVGGGMSSSR